MSRERELGRAQLPDDPKTAWIVTKNDVTGQVRFFLSTVRDFHTGENFTYEGLIQSSLPHGENKPGGPVSLLDPQYENFEPKEPEKTSDTSPLPATLDAAVLSTGEPVTLFSAGKDGGANGHKPVNGRVVADPEVRRNLIAENDMAFYHALAVIVPPRKATPTGEPPYIVMSTESGKSTGGQSPVRTLLKETIGTKGEIVETPRELHIRLPWPQFAFLLNEPHNTNKDYFDSKNRFVPFFLAALLSQDGARIVLRDKRKLLDNLYRGASNHLLLSLGELPTHGLGKNKNLSAVTIEDLQTVLSRSMGHPAVTSLSFYDNLKGLPQFSAPASSAV